MSSSIKLCILFAAATSVLTAADPALSTLSATLTPMRSQDLDTLGPRGASPQLTIAKHQLREWVESKLTTLKDDGDEAQLSATLNAELKAASLTCEADTCPVANMLGFVGDLSLTRASTFLLVKTGVGIECGHDESAYLYRHEAGSWHLFWQSEQNRYGDEEYKPQHLDKVLIAPQDAPNDYPATGQRPAPGPKPPIAENWRSPTPVCRVQANSKEPSNVLPSPTSGKSA